MNCYYCLPLCFFQNSNEQHYRDFFYYGILIISDLLIDFLYIWPYTYIYSWGFQILLPWNHYYYSSGSLTYLLYWPPVYIFWIIPLQVGNFNCHGFLIICSCGLLIAFSLLLFDNLRIPIDLLYSYLLGARFIGRFYWTIIPES